MSAGKGRKGCQCPPGQVRCDLHRCHQLLAAGPRRDQLERRCRFQAYNETGLCVKHGALEVVKDTKRG